MRNFFRLFLGIYFLLFLQIAYAVETHTKIWLSSVFTGSLTCDKNFKYYIEPDVRFIDDKYKFHQSLLWLGLGYQWHPDLSVYVGDTPDTTRNLSGQYNHANIVWQRVNWSFYSNDRISAANRAQLEETKNNHDAPWSIILRERLLFTFPLKNWQQHALVVYDEVFFNLKHPNWVNNNSFIAQNRAYIGISTKLTNYVTLDTGYINQYQFTTTNQMSNILLVGLVVHSD